MVSTVFVCRHFTVCTAQKLNNGCYGVKRASQVEEFAFLEVCALYAYARDRFSKVKEKL